MMIPPPTVTRSTGAPAAISQIARLSSSIFPTSDINDITPLSPPIIMIKNNRMNPSIINITSSPFLSLISSSQM